jgi:hypothetical protein
MSKPFGVMRWRTPRIEHSDVVFVMAAGRVVAFSEDGYVDADYLPALEELPWAEDLLEPLTGVSPDAAERSFDAFIRERKITDDPIGDFVGDARHDAKMPNVKRWSELRQYLESRHVSEDVVNAARRTWHEYEGWRTD